MTAAAPRLLCIGDLGLDLVVRVPQLPGRDEKVTGTPVACGPGGMAANVAAGAARLGTPARLVAVTGDDAMGAQARAALAAEGVDLSHVATRPGSATFYCMILLDDSGEKALVRAAGDTFLPAPEDLSPAAFDGVAHVHAIFTEPALFRRTRALARQAGATLSLDLEPADIPEDNAALDALVASADILFLGARSRAAVEARLGALRPRPGALVVTTRGAAGAELEGGGTRQSVPGHPVRAVDTLGAGDAFAAAFLHAWLGGRLPAEALAFANAAGALATQGYGAQSALPRAAEVTRLMAGAEARHA